MKKALVHLMSHWQNPSQTEPLASKHPTPPDHHSPRFPKAYCYRYVVVSGNATVTHDTFSPAFVLPDLLEFFCDTLPPLLHSLQAGPTQRHISVL